MLSTLFTLGGLFYLGGWSREHETAVRYSIASMGSFWAGVLFTSLISSTVFGYGLVRFQKTLVHHKDIREYRPYFRYKAKFVPETAHVNGSV